MISILEKDLELKEVHQEYQKKENIIVAIPNTKYHKDEIWSNKSTS